MPLCCAVHVTQMHHAVPLNELGAEAVNQLYSQPVGNSKCISATHNAGQLGVAAWPSMGPTVSNSVTQGLQDSCRSLLQLHEAAACTVCCWPGCCTVQLVWHTPPK